MTGVGTNTILTAAEAGRHRQLELAIALSAGILLFFCLYRVAIGHPAVMLNLPVGGVGFLLILYTPIGKVLWMDVGWRRVLLCAAALFVYSVATDWYAMGSGLTVRNSLSIRMATLGVMSFCSALAIVHMLLKGKVSRLKGALLVCISIQLMFFVVLYSAPELKFLVYAMFGMQDSPNLFEWNLFTRGFGVGAELNFTAPIVTAIIALLLFRNWLFKAVVVLSQLANTTLAIFSLVFLARHLVSFIIVIGAVSLSYLYLPAFASLVQEILPRFSTELLSGFAITATELLHRHLIYEGRTIVDLFFGTGVNLLPETGKEHSSDIGWIIMVNYGGLFSVILVMVFVLTVIAVTPFNIVTKALLFGCALILNTKGFVLGPNAFFFFLFLVALNSLKAPDDPARSRRV